LLVGLAAILETVFMAASRLPEAAYRQVLFATGPVAVLADHGLEGGLVLAAGFGVLVAAVRWRSLGPLWGDFEHVTRLRWLVGGVAIMLAWIFATYDYNFYLDRAHWLARLLLVGVVPLIFWRPAFVALFLFLLLPIGHQFFHPFGGWSWAATMLPIRILFLFLSLACLRVVTRRVGLADFVFVLCCMVAAHYWVSGLQKVRFGWVSVDYIGFLLASTYANGWLGFLGPETIGKLIRGLLVLNVSMKIGTLAVECGALVVLWKRRTLRWFLIAAIGFHCAIFTLTGIGFWPWIVVDALILFLFFRRGGPVLRMFTAPHFVVSVILIAGCSIWFRPQSLAWLDARATYTYRFEAEGANGRAHRLPAAFFTPFEFQFTLVAFRFLVDAPRLPISWGATGNRELAEQLNRATTADQILDLEATVGQNTFDPGRAAAFDHFMREFVTHWQNREGRGRRIPLLAAPVTLWTFPRRDPALGGERIRRVLVYEILSWYDGENYSVIRERVVREITLE
jgi:hypothetical protein